MSLFIRATVYDAPMITKLARQTFWDTFSPYNLESDMNLYLDQAFTEEKQREEILNPKIHTFIVPSSVHNEMQAVGFVQLLESKPEACVNQTASAIEISRFYFDKAFHGKGIASDAMKFSLDYAKKQGFETVWLGVWEENHRARKFYEKWKFQTVGSHIFKLGNDPQNDLILERTLKDL